MTTQTYTPEHFKQVAQAKIAAEQKAQAEKADAKNKAIIAVCNEALNDCLGDFANLFEVDDKQAVVVSNTGYQCTVKTFCKLYGYDVEFWLSVDLHDAPRIQNIRVACQRVNRGSYIESVTEDVTKGMTEAVIGEVLIASEGVAKLVRQQKAQYALDRIHGQSETEIDNREAEVIFEFPEVAEAAKKRAIEQRRYLAQRQAEEAERIRRNEEWKREQEAQRKQQEEDNARGRALQKEVWHPFKLYKVFHSAFDTEAGDVYVTEVYATEFEHCENNVFECKVLRYGGKIVDCYIPNVLRIEEEHFETVDECFGLPLRYEQIGIVHVIYPPTEESHTPTPAAN